MLAHASRVCSVGGEDASACVAVRESVVATQVDEATRVKARGSSPAWQGQTKGGCFSISHFDQVQELPKGEAANLDCFCDRTHI